MPDIGKLKQVQQGAVHISSVSGGTLHPAKVEVAVIEWTGDTYEGPYTVTPGAEAQHFSTTGKRFTEDLIVNPVPSNYGLITWDGSALTVS